MAPLRRARSGPSFLVLALPRVVRSSPEPRSWLPHTLNDSSEAWLIGPRLAPTGRGPCVSPTSDKEISPMTTTTTRTEPNGKVRKSLADQIDRLDGILDGLDAALSGAVQDAVEQAVRQAV